MKIILSLDALVSDGCCIALNLIGDWRWESFSNLIGNDQNPDLAASIDYEIQWKIFVIVFSNVAQML